MNYNKGLADWFTSTPDGGRHAEEPKGFRRTHMVSSNRPPAALDLLGIAGLAIVLIAFLMSVAWALGAPTP